MATEAVTQESVEPPVPCSETVFAKGQFRGVRCLYPAKYWVTIRRSSGDYRRAMCGVHARRYRADLVQPFALAAAARGAGSPAALPDTEVTE